jgi:hypothetical protein
MEGTLTFLLPNPSLPRLTSKACLKSAPHTKEHFQCKKKKKIPQCHILPWV